MATRRERVVLDLEDNFTTGVARAAAASKLLSNSLDDLSGHAVRSSRDLDKSSQGVDRLGQSGRRSGPEIDRMSGRLRLFADAALTLGPAIIPLAAGSIPALTGALAGLGAAASGIGVTVLALNGIGDAVGAISDARLEPTAVNIEKMRDELAKLGPAGKDFAKYIADLEPAFRRLQETARAEMFPGLVDGIEALTSRGPQVTRIIETIAGAVGDIARESGEGLASDRWTPFFDYLEREAKPTLQAFAEATGNVALGVANLIVAFGGITGDFTSGLVRATDAFARWSEGLDSNQSFQNFLQYIRESGPQVVEFLGAMGSAIAGLLEAAAPVGSAVLPALTALAQLFGALAGSPIGPVLYTAAAGMIAFNRASSLVTRSITGIESGAARLGTSLNTPTSQLEKIGRTAAGIAAVGIAVGAIADGVGRIDSANLDRSLQALGEGNITDNVDQIVTSLENLTATRNKIDFGEIVTAGGLFGDTSLDKYADNIKQVDQALAQMVESGDVAKAQETFAALQEQFEKAGISSVEAASYFDQYKTALANSGLDGFGGVLGAVTNALGPYADAAGTAAGANDELGSSVRSAMEAMREQRQEALATFDAVTAYRQAMKDAAAQAKTNNAGIKGNSDAALANRGALSQLAGAWNNLDNKTKNAAGAFRNARKDFIDTAEAMGVPKAAAKALADQILEIPKSRQIKITADTGNATATLRALQARVDGLRDRTIHVNVVTNNVRPQGGQAPTEDNVTTNRGTPLGPRGRGSVGGLPIEASDVYVNGRGSAGAKAEMYAAASPAAAAVVDLARASDGAAGKLNRLNRALDAQQKSLDRAKQRLDDARGRRDEISSNIVSGLGGDIWGASEGSVWAAGAHGANSPQGAVAILNEQKAKAQRLVAAINTLKSKGITGPVLAEIIGSGDVERAEAMAALDTTTLTSFAATYNDTQSALAAAGLAGGNAVVGEGNLQRLEKHYADELKELREIKQAIKDADGNNQGAQQQNAEAVGHWVNGAAANGHRRGRR